MARCWSMFGRQEVGLGEAAQLGAPSFVVLTEIPIDTSRQPPTPDRYAQFKYSPATSCHRVLASRTLPPSRLAPRRPNTIVPMSPAPTTNLPSLRHVYLQCYGVNNTHQFTN